MSYLVCIPAPELVSRENCEKIHNILARMSDQYRLNIVPEPVKMRQGKYPELKEQGGNAEPYLAPDEESMLLSVCRNADEEALMKGCTYAYQYPANKVLKVFREDKREKRRS